jgi:hypothetical protein
MKVVLKHFREVIETLPEDFHTWGVMATGGHLQKVMFLIAG